jgi:hypothetical protein
MSLTEFACGLPWINKTCFLITSFPNVFVPPGPKDRKGNFPISPSQERLQKMREISNLVVQYILHWGTVYKIIIKTVNINIKNATF